jgi:hypothetical protein
MNAILLYRANSKLTAKHYLVVSDNHLSIYIRAERVEANSLSDALDLAKPQEGETFINSIPAP